MAFRTDYTFGNSKAAPNLGLGFSTQCCFWGLLTFPTADGALIWYSVHYVSSIYISFYICNRWLGIIIFFKLREKLAHFLEPMGFTFTAPVLRFSAKGPPSPFPWLTWRGVTLKMQGRGIIIRKQKLASEIGENSDEYEKTKVRQNRPMGNNRRAGEDEKR